MLTFYFKPNKHLKIGATVFEYEKDALNKTLVAIFLFTVTLWALNWDEIIKSIQS